jgi:uncharacterized protein with ParB-like and HNH nuclease domain
MRDGEFEVPPYQREFTWEPERKSRFIESVIMGLPIPFLFFWEMEDSRLEIRGRIAAPPHHPGIRTNRLLKK